MSAKGPFKITFVGEGPIESGHHKIVPDKPRVGDTVRVYQYSRMRVEDGPALVGDSHIYSITEEVDGEWIARYFPPPKAVKL